MNNFKVLGKFLDQPILVSKFQKAVPAILTAGACAYTINDIKKQNKENRKKHALKTSIIMGATVATALSAPYAASKITKRPLPNTLNTIKQKNKELCDTFIKEMNPDKTTTEIIEKGKNKVLKFKEVKHLFENFNESEKGKKFLKDLIPDPENVKAKDIFSEIGYLSIYGAIPVLGGIAGGIIADKMVDKENWKSKVPDKVKEGTYQYLANIFMCNVGAGIALGLLEKAGIRSKSARALGMTAGIITTGIIGGSKIANIIGNKVIEPVCQVFTKNKKEKEKIEDNLTDILDIDFINHKKSPFIKNYYNKNQIKDEDDSHKERTPEPLDICLHTDDIATVSLLSGLKWIEPALPVMYTVSGYRAGIGYRNN